MQQNDFLRFALILSSGQAATFKKNLEKIIKLILWDSYSTPLSSLEISRRAKDVYSLSFSADEIEKVIIKSHSNSFVIIIVISYYMLFMIFKNHLKMKFFFPKIS